MPNSINFYKGIFLHVIPAPIIVPSSNELSKIRKRIKLRAKFSKNEYFKAKADKINQSAINRELHKLFSRAKKQESTLKPALGKCHPRRKSLTISKNISIRFNPIQLLPKNLVVTFQNLFVSCQISQITFPSIMKYQPLMRFRNIFTN